MRFENRIDGFPIEMGDLHLKPILQGDNHDPLTNSLQRERPDVFPRRRKIRGNTQYFFSDFHRNLLPPLYRKLHSIVNKTGTLFIRVLKYIHIYLKYRKIVVFFDNDSCKGG